MSVVTFHSCGPALSKHESACCSDDLPGTGICQRHDLQNPSVVGHPGTLLEVGKQVWG